MTSTNLQSAICVKIRDTCARGMKSGEELFREETTVTTLRPAIKSNRVTKEL